MVSHKDVDYVDFESDVLAVEIILIWHGKILKSGPMSEAVMPVALAEWAKRTEEKPNSFMSEMLYLSGEQKPSWQSPHTWNQYLLTEASTP